MKRKADIAIGQRFVEELYRMHPESSDRKIAVRMGCASSTIQEWREGKAPGTMYLRRFLELGGDVDYVLTGRRKPKENPPDFLAELEEEY